MRRGWAIPRAGYVAFQGAQGKQFALFFRGVAFICALGDTAGLSRLPPEPSAHTRKSQAVAPAGLHCTRQMRVLAEARILGQHGEGGLSGHGDEPTIA